MKEKYTVKPKGWLLDFLNTQLDGLTGHIEEAGFPYDTVEWGGEEFIFGNGKPEWWVYEQTAYWVDGLVRTAILTENKEALAHAEGIIYRVLSNPDTDGYLGPRVLKSGENASRWPHVVFFRACMGLYEHNRDTAIIDALTAHYLNEKDSDHVWRDVNNVEIILWLYGITRDSRLLVYAEESYKKYNDRRGSDSIDAVALSRRKPREHGVSHNEYSKLGAILYMHTGKREYLRASVSAYRKIDRFFMLPGGCLCSNEHMLDNMYYQSYETCNITDMTWSLSYLYAATGDVEYADKIERCIFNAGLGSVTEDFRALQYYSSANQAFSDASSNHNNVGDERGWMRYSPNPGTACCPGNVNRFMPNYVLNMWQSDSKTVTSGLFGPSRFSYSNGDEYIDITEDTVYPFEDVIRYKVKTNTSFRLRIRKPKWAIGFSVTDGDGRSLKVGRGRFFECEISADTVLVVKMEYELEEVKCAGGVYLRRGPLVYSLFIDEKRTAYIDVTNRGKHFPDYSIRPASEWRYALVGDYKFESGNFTGISDRESMPYVCASARNILNLERDARDPLGSGESKTLGYDSYTFTPRLLGTHEPVLGNMCTSVKLLPYGVCKIRMTVLNKI